MGSMLAKNLLHTDSKRQKLKKTPKDYGMKNYEEIEFKTKDNVNIKGWFIKGDPKKPLIIICHPMPMCRSGFDPKQQGLFKASNLEVELLKTCQILNKNDPKNDAKDNNNDNMNYNIITFDFRNHGESGKSLNGYTTIGIKEHLDILGCLDYISQRNDIKNLPIGFCSECMGANSTLIAFSKDKSKFKNVKCLFCIQPVSMDVLVPSMLKNQFPLFSGCVASINKKAKEYTGGFGLEDMTPLKIMKDISIPICISQFKRDPWTKNSDIQSIYDSIPKSNVNKSLIWIDKEYMKERFDAYNYFNFYPKEMLNFFEKHFKNQSTNEE